MDLAIRELNPKHEADWDAYVESHPEATFCHQVGWKRVLELSYGFNGRYLLAHRNGAICGVLPLVHVRRFPFPPALISTPLCVYGGVIAEDDNVARELEDAAAALARSLNVSYLELRNRKRLRAGWTVSNSMATFRKRISDDCEVNLLAIPGPRRAHIRRGIKLGFTVASDSELLRFMPVYARRVRDLGSPVYPTRFFQALLNIFGSRCRIKTVIFDGIVQASAMNFYFKDEVISYYVASIPGPERSAVNAFLYWDTMREAAEEGCRVVDFSRSAVGTGTYVYKKRWGIEPALLNYQYCLVTASMPPNITPLNPRYRLAIKTWQKLPLAVAGFLGPMVSKAVV